MKWHGVLLGVSIILTACSPNATPTPLPYPTAIAKLANQTALDLGTRIALAAQAQVGVTTIYDPQYVRLVYPNGDVPIERGVCTDVIIRAYRAIGVDLQARVHEDMARNFSVYPKDWGMTAPDANIDHRRVQNLAVYFTRMGKQIKDTTDASFKPGDVVTWQLQGWMQHTGIVSSEKIAGTDRYAIVHNMGSGTYQEDALHWFTIIGHYRW